MGINKREMMVQGWAWRKHTSKTSGKDMLAVAYYGGLSDNPVTEYFAITHDGYAGQKALQKLANVASQAQVKEGGLNVETLEDMALNLTEATPPTMIKYVKKGKFNEVLERQW
jgi:DNA repair protein RadD